MHLSSHLFACVGRALTSALNSPKQLASKLSERKEGSYADITYLWTNHIGSTKEFHPSHLKLKTLGWREVVDASMGAVFEERML